MVITTTLRCETCGETADVRWEVPPGEAPSAELALAKASAAVNWQVNTIVRPDGQVIAYDLCPRHRWPRRPAAAGGAR
jgi:hypothetical protein